MNDNSLIAMALREHAQTCEDIAAKYAAGSTGRGSWERRAERCRQLARRYEAAKEPDYAQLFERGLRQTGHCICGDAMRAIGEHREDCPARGRA